MSAPRRVFAAIQKTVTKPLWTILQFYIRCVRVSSTKRWSATTVIVHLLHPLARQLPTGLRHRIAGIFAKTPVMSVAENRTFSTIAGLLADEVEAGIPPNVIHLHDQIALLTADRLKKSTGATIVWDAHEIYQDLASAQPERGRMNERIICENASLVDRFVTINDSIANFYLKAHPALPKAVVVKNATIPIPFPKDDGRLHEAAGLAKEQKLLLFQGGFGPKRGLKELIEAAGLIGPSWTLVMMGWGNLEAELREQAAALPVRGGAPRVVFLPGVPQDDLPLWSAGASLGAIPYENTGLNHLYCTPNKLWEYPNAGVPILATDLEEMAATINAFGTGFLIPRNFTAMEIAEVVDGLTDMQLEEARDKCRQFMVKDNWHKYAPRLVDMYADIQNEENEKSPVPNP